jgi:hypothetical protein
MKLRKIALLALAATVAGTMASFGGSDGPTKLWEASGFENPESALPDTAAGVVYVSNVAGSPAGKDGNGFISKLTIDGDVTALKWVTGLDSPKGLALAGGKLYVADLDQLVEIDVATGTIAARHQAPGAKILNDVAADKEGRIYISDWPGNAIWRLADGKLEKWLESPDLKCPNGLLVEGDKLIVAAWGTMEPDFSTKVPGNLLAVDVGDKTIANLGNGKPVGNLDGIEPYDAESYIVSDWVAGKVFRIAKTGEASELASLGQGTADINFLAASRTLVVPMMTQGKVAAFKL